MSQYYSAIQKEILLFVTTQMDLEGFMLNEMSDRKRQTLYDLIYMWNLEKMEVKMIQTDGEIHHALGLEESTL